MSKLVVFFCAAIAWLAPCPALAVQHQAPPPQRPVFSSQEMAKRIASLDPEQAMPAVVAVWESYGKVSDQVTPAVVTAMIEALDYALEQKNRFYAGLDFDDRDGLLDHEGLVETLLRSTSDLMVAVPELRDPRAIPVLLKAARGGGVGDGILAFGPRAVLPHALACASNPEMLENHLAGCIMVLVDIMVVWGRSMDAATRSSIRAFTVEHLKQRDGVRLVYLASLARAIGWDAELTALVRERLQEVDSGWEREALQGSLAGNEPHWVPSLRARYASVPY